MNPRSCNSSAYVGGKGYTILKKDVSDALLAEIKTELSIKPYTFSNLGARVFKVYRENAAKLYVPRYYGLRKIGVPLDGGSRRIFEKVCKIVVPFTGRLREYQEPIVDKYLKDIKLHEIHIGGGALLDMYCGSGKTSTALNIISCLGVKTAIICHAEFLMNQWIERMNLFLPTARIGRIQGQTVDIEEKDIVLIMLQTLVSKQFTENVFETFGLCIIDETHHISSEHFSNALFKIVTPYMLGLSATMERKDGTSHVIKMFLGDVSTKLERPKGDYDVTICAVQYAVYTDDEFAQQLTDFRGNPAFSTMLSKISTYNARTEFVLRVLCDFIATDRDKMRAFAHRHRATVPTICKRCNSDKQYLMRTTCCDTVEYCLSCLLKICNDAKTPIPVLDKKTRATIYKKCRPKCPGCAKVLAYEQEYVPNPFVLPYTERQTIILAHQLCVLDYMYSKIVSQNLASVGYYIGGMSETELKKSEMKQVILATYTMAKEALDIPTLNAEFCVTPLTDVTQSSGRILRAKSTLSPVIFDFIDMHDMFQKQWIKRRAYYKSEKYRIVETTNDAYIPDYTTWKSVYTPPSRTTVAAVATQKQCTSAREGNDDTIMPPPAKCLIPLSVFKKKQ